MADLFEQLIADYLTDDGYLCELNVNYRKADGKGSYSDIDVLALRKRPPHDVIVADCKSWGAGLWGDWLLDDESKSGVAERTYFKAIFQSEWAEGLANKVEEELGTRKFAYTIFCTRINQSPKYGGVSQLEQRLVAGNPIRVVPFASVIEKTVERLRIKKRRSRAVEPTTLGRIVQLLDHAQIDLEPR